MARAEGNSRGAMDGALRWIGDLDHPFYNDERQRFVWYEASAIGFQLMLMMQSLMGGMTLLIFGGEAWKYVMVALAPTLLTTVVVAAYASQRGASYFATSSDFKRSRGIFAGVVGIVWVAGALRAGPFGPDGSDMTWDFSSIAGAITGFAIVGLGIYAGTKWQQRSAKRNEIADD